MLDPVRSGDTAFTACLQLFRNYPLAVRRHYAEHRYGTMVLLDRAAEAPRYYVLIMKWDDLFELRHWDRRDGAGREIRPHEPVSGEVQRLIETSVPVPRDGALLGWVSGQQVIAVFAAYGRIPEPWDDASVVPGVLVLPLVGSQPAQWPPLAASPLDDGALWDYVARGQLTDLGPLVTHRAGRAFWVPGGGSTTGRRAGARVVVPERLSADDFWLPAGVYADHWTLREGPQVLTARQLLALPGVVDLGGGRGQHLLGV